MYVSTFTMYILHCTNNLTENSLYRCESDIEQWDHLKFFYVATLDVDKENNKGQVTFILIVATTIEY